MVRVTNIFRQLVAVSQSCNPGGIPWSGFLGFGSPFIRGEDRAKCTDRHHTDGDARLNLKPEILVTLNDICMSVSTRKSYA